jgi:hypothetical protein
LEHIVSNTSIRREHLQRESQRPAFVSLRGWCLDALTAEDVVELSMSAQTTRKALTVVLPAKVVDDATALLKQRDETPSFTLGVLAGGRVSVHFARRP